MRLSEFYSALSHGDKGAFKIKLAQHLAVSEFTARSYLQGDRKIPAKHLAKIELFTGGVVTCKELSEEMASKEVSENG
ncbi:YdaS family helix-turn-helix protein [Alishewanella sp. SMS9]|nr:YdaS family helix-turn-helix protein [Alishewanella sp. SMS9]